MRSPETQTLYDIFNGRIQYVVAVYQRPYVWTQADNWAPLWADIKDTVERYLDDPGANRPLKHFLGAVVLEQQPTAPGGVDQRLLIDGQQRLTTLQLVLGATSAVAREHGVETVAAEIDDLTLNRAKAAVGDLRFKVLPSRRDRAPFKAMLDPEVPPTGGGADIPGAWSYFLDAIRDWVSDTTDEDGTSPERRLEALHACLDSLLYVVSINLDESDNAQVIFETLNARGTPLTALDLAKNLVFLQAEREKADVAELHDEYWERTFERDGYWLEEIRQGRLKRPRADLFLMHWLTMQLGHVVAATQLFETFRRDVARDASMLQLVPEMCADAEVLRRFDRHEPGSHEALFFARLEMMDTTTLLPLALLLFRSPEVTEERRRHALWALESWLVRRTVLRMTAKNYNRILASLLSTAKDNLDVVDEAVIDELRRSDAVTARWPDDTEFRDRLENRDLYWYIAQQRVRLLLEAIERALRDPAKTESIELPAGLSIEHVLPQSWEDHWPLPSDEDPEVALERRGSRIHRLGNLTLVTGPLNSLLSNAPWSIPMPADANPDEPWDKRSALRQHSVLLLNERIVRKDEWDEHEIDVRSHRLAELIIQTWPGPEADVWKPHEPDSSQRQPPPATPEAVDEAPAQVPALPCSHERERCPSRRERSDQRDPRPARGGPNA